MARLQFPTVDEMTPEQRNVHDEVVSGIRGRLVGPLRAVIHSPDLARRWSRLGEYLRFSTCLPKKLNELAIIVPDDVGTVSLSSSFTRRPPKQPASTP